MRNQLSTNSYQQSAVSDLSFPSKREVRFLTSSLSGCLSTYGWLTGQSRIKALDSPIKSENDRKKLYRNDYNLTVSDNSEAGFTLVELMITMAIFLIVIASVSGVFTSLLTQFKQQSKISETNIEGIIGLDILRRDVEHAGYGLPWNIPSGTTYTEASSTTPCGSASANPSTYNDSTANPPKAIVSGNGNCTNGSDYLVIKAVNVATNASSQKWTELIYNTACTSPFSSCATNVCKRDWTPSTENLTSTDYITVISPGASSAPSSTTSRLLMANSGAYTAINFNCSSIPSSWLPTSATDNIRIVYGLSSNSNAPQRPFNRTDYYIATASVPQRCAPNTGVLEKATMDYSGGFTQYPILDCVADMQVGFGVDTDTTQDGQINCYTNDLASVLTTVNAQNIRERVKEIRIYILAHEGQYDGSFTFNPPVSPSSIKVGEVSTSLPTGTGICTGETIIGRNFDLSGITNWQNYRWKVYTLVLKPNNLK